MNLSREWLEKAKTAKSAQELTELAKAVGVDLTTEQAETAFAELHSSGELADEELNNVAAGCCGGDSVPDATWGNGGVWNRSEDVVFDFDVGTRVVVYPTPSTWAKGTITAKETRRDDWGWYPAYLIHHDDSKFADEWHGQIGVGKLH